MAKTVDDGAAERQGASPYITHMGRQPGCDCPSKESCVSQSHETHTDKVSLRM